MGGMGGRRGCALEGTRPPGPGDPRCLFSYFFSILSPPQVVHALLLLPLPSPGAGQHLHSIPRQPRTQSE